MASALTPVALCPRRVASVRIDGELIATVGGLTVSNHEQGNEVIEGRPEVMDKFAKNDRPSERNRFSDWLWFDRVPSRQRVVIVDDRVELAREPSADLALNRLKVFSGAGDLLADAIERSSHVGFGPDRTADH
jgi:hypothetical protein